LCLAVEAVALTKQFGQIRALDSITFNIKPGEIYGLIGPNGAGKTTTLRIVCTLIKPTAGTIKIFNHFFTPSIPTDLMKPAPLLPLPSKSFCSKTKPFHIQKSLQKMLPILGNCKLPHYMYRLFFCARFLIVFFDHPFNLLLQLPLVNVLRYRRRQNLLPV
jgi:energy-coupling factor transporter ATP-binding protein EcfA2